MKNSRKALVVLVAFSVILLSPLAFARPNGVDLTIQKISFSHKSEAGQMAYFDVVVKNKGSLPSSNLYLTFDTGNGGGIGIAGPFIIEPGKTLVFGFGTAYSSGRYVVKAFVNTTGDTNPDNNEKTAKIFVK